jgi:hypothetical protein
MGLAIVGVVLGVPVLLFLACGGVMMLGSGPSKRDGAVAQNGAANKQPEQPKEQPPDEQPIVRVRNDFPAEEPRKKGKGAKAKDAKAKGSGDRDEGKPALPPKDEDTPPPKDKAAPKDDTPPRDKPSRPDEPLVFDLDKLAAGQVGSFPAPAKGEAGHANVISVLDRGSALVRAHGRDLVLAGVNAVGWKPGRAVSLDGQWEVKGRRVVQGKQRWEFVRKTDER